MSTLYLDRKHLRLQATSGVLRVEPGGHGRGTYPLSLIRRIVLRGNIAFDSSTLACLADAGVTMVCLGGRGHRRVATIIGAPGPEARRRLAQYRAASSTETATWLAAAAVRAKILAYRHEAARLVRRRPKLRKAGHDLNRTLQITMSGIQNCTLPGLRGHEGAASAAWFRFYAEALPPRLGFRGRNRQPPRDPVNAALSLAYTLAHGEAVSAALAQGLDPMLGFLHEPLHARESLACDLIEPLRPRIDARVLRAFADNRLRPEHFSAETNGCRLTKTGRAEFFALWETAAPLFRRYLRHAVFRLLRELREDRS